MFLATPVRAEILVNIVDLPGASQLKAGLGFSPKSTTEYELDDSGGLTFESKGGALAIAGTYGLSDDAGIYATAGVVNKKFAVGGYSLVNLLGDYKTLAYAQYQIFKGTLDLAELDNSFGTELEADLDGKEISLGLLALFEQSSGIVLYAGPEFIATSDFTAEATNITRSFDYKRKDKIGALLGFSKPIKDNTMHFYGNASLVGDPSFHIGVSKDF